MMEKTIGEMIAALRREKGMTQKELGDLLHVTDKAVSKWERNAAFPDTATIPKLAEILGVSVEDLLQAKSVPATGHRGAGYLVQLLLRVIPLAMGAAVTVLAILNQLDAKSAAILLGIGLFCVGLHLMKNQ